MMSVLWTWFQKDKLLYFSALCLGEIPNLSVLGIIIGVVVIVKVETMSPDEIKSLDSRF